MGFYKISLKYNLFLVPRTYGELKHYWRLAGAQLGYVSHVPIPCGFVVFKSYESKGTSTHVFPEDATMSPCQLNIRSLEMGWITGFICIYLAKPVWLAFFPRIPWIPWTKSKLLETNGTYFLRQYAQMLVGCTVYTRMATFTGWFHRKLCFGVGENHANIMFNCVWFRLPPLSNSVWKCIVFLADLEYGLVKTSSLKLKYVWESDTDYISIYVVKWGFPKMGHPKNNGFTVGFNNKIH